MVARRELVGAGSLRGAPAPPPEVTAPNVRRIDGIKTHPGRHIDPREATTWKGIPITTVPRTLVDLAAVLSFDDLALACEAVLARRPAGPGTGNLRRILRGEARVALSPLEKRFLGLLGQASLPLPVTDRPAGTRRVDCRWPDHKLAVELDSYHNSRHTWEQDRRREREAPARCDDFRRYIRGDVAEDGGLILRELRSLL